MEFLFTPKKKKNMLTYIALHTTIGFQAGGLPLVYLWEFKHLMITITKPDDWLTIYLALCLSLQDSELQKIGAWWATKNSRRRVESTVPNVDIVFSQIAVVSYSHSVEEPNPYIESSHNRSSSWTPLLCYCSHCNDKVSISRRGSFLKKSNLSCERSSMNGGMGGISFCTSLARCWKRRHTHTFLLLSPSFCSCVMRVCWQCMLQPACGIRRSVFFGSVHGEKSSQRKRGW